MVCWGDVQGKYGASGRMIRLRLTLTGRCTAALSSLDFAIVIAYQVTLSLLMSLRDMVHPGGFEPPTARFVAEYSIQLSYGCIGIYCFTAGSTSSLLMSLRNMVHPGGFEPPTARFVAEYSIQLSYGCIGIYYFTADISIAAKAILSKRWCIREDSNLRPLGS